ncbi:MAG: CoA transferase, partial [Acidimicrobiales bacterium]|nr:CoA transferase [Acidimicrobiales bacterium]
HLVDRQAIVTSADGLVHPRPPYRLNGAAMGARTPAPRLGEHHRSLQPWPPRRMPDSAPVAFQALPLAGVKVLDLTSWWVGAMATHTLALLGADVIHVEGVAHPDGMRLTGSTFARTEDWWEWGHMFAAANTDKRGITLDLGSDTGRDLLRGLIRWADVFVENFSPRVVESWGLDRDAVLAINPGIVYQRMPAYGLTGPWRDRPAFAQTIEPMSTMASITGYPDALPVAKGGIPDPIAGTHGAWAALVGLAERDRSGAGVFCEAVMIEAALNVCAQPLLERAAYGHTMQRLGNRSPHAAPQGVYPCAGNDAWVAISIVAEEHWQALAQLVGGAELAADPRFGAVADRHANHDELDALLSSWTAARDADATADELRRRGVPAAACWDARLIADHPSYVARRVFEPVEHPVLGTIRVPGLPYRFASVDRWVGAPAPRFGEHTHAVLRDVLALDSAAIAQLESDGVITDRPRGL